MSWQTTSFIRPRNPPCGRRSLPEKDCACGAEWFRCHRQELLAVCPGYFQRGLRRELVSCSLVCIGPRNPQIRASLKSINKINTYNNHTWYNGYNYHSQNRHIFPASSAHSKDLGPVSVIADAENRSKNRAYQTVSRDTTKAPSWLSIPGCLIKTMSKRWLPWKGLAENGIFNGLQ